MNALASLRAPDLRHDLRFRAALAGALTSALTSVPIVVLVWIAVASTPKSTASTLENAAAGAGLWALLAGARVNLDGVTIAFTPLLGLALVVGLGWWAATRSARYLAAEVEEAEGATNPADLRWAFGLGAGAFALFLVILARFGPLSPGFLSSLIPIAVWPALWNERFFRSLFDTARPFSELLDRAFPERSWSLPVAWRRGWPVGVRAALVLIGAGSLLLLVAVIHAWPRIALIWGEIGATGIGAFALGLVQLLAWPNLALWVASALTGAGFSVGGASEVTLGGASSDLLPMIPILGAHPQPGPFPFWAKLLVVIPILVGYWLARRTLTVIPRLSSTKVKVRTTAAAVASCVLVTIALTLLGGRSLGVALLAQIGPPIFSFGVHLAICLAIGAALALVRDWVQLRK